MGWGVGGIVLARVQKHISENNIFCITLFSDMFNVKGPEKADLGTKSLEIVSKQQ